jgi:hypothetical protein
MYTPRAHIICSGWGFNSDAEPEVWLETVFILCVSMMIDRYRLIRTFGRNTIRKFNNNASAMKKLAARDFEDLLQVRTFFISLSQHHKSAR